MESRKSDNSAQPALIGGDKGKRARLLTIEGQQKKTAATAQSTDRNTQKIEILPLVEKKTARTTLR